MYKNIAYYKFIPLNKTHELKSQLLSKALECGLKGTVLLASEGINSCLVGLPESVDAFVTFLKTFPEFADIDFKESFSEEIPFRRMLVKVKKEILPSGFSPLSETPAKYVESLELKNWLDNNKDLVLIDTRNDYEVKLGTFENAINPQIKNFMEFQKWVEEQPEELKKKEVVTYCTGGIRCEKATAFMLKKGFKNVFQLKGGILKYFEETKKMGVQDENHYQGDCFVFDYRVAVDRNLERANYDICYICWNSLSSEDLKHHLYIKDVQCHHCADMVKERELKRAKICEENNRKALEVRKERAKVIKQKLGLMPTSPENHPLQY